MLQIKNISKKYKTGNLIQKALDDVSLNLRDNEFVGILGPSGSGKTTLLNIIGGLDRYDSGDLIINNVSTKKYKDKDWDSYRNHTIGFVFQSYNLIGHQNILSNVELALTISGISKSQRRIRAINALEKVGLKDQIYKKPNQLSGGQMQRVAIARALVNDPDIVLADEPTGALDSETSVQIMNLLKEVAKDRLVVMVTHNPELADLYASRIVNIKDGKIVSDSNPLDIEENNQNLIYKNLGKASMSFLTSLSLSFNNLKTKKARTFLVAFAGSIGIIGISLILALSNGVNKYIKNQESSTLAAYPLIIEKQGFDLNKVMSNSQDNQDDDSKKNDDKIGVQYQAKNLFSGIKNNDLKALKSYFLNDKKEIKNYTKAIEYTYDISPEIYTNDGSIKKINPSTGGAPSLSSGANPGFSSIMNANINMSQNIFYPLPKTPGLYQNSYDLKAGSWPKKSNDLLLVLSKQGKVSDVLLYQLGIKDPKELEDMMNNKSTNSENESFDYKQFIGKTFKLVKAVDYYTYDQNYKLWINNEKDQNFLKNLVNQGQDLKIVGIVQPKEDNTTMILNRGIYYPNSLAEEIIAYSQNKDVIKDQLANPNVNIFTGKEFGSQNNNFDLSKLFSFNPNALKNAFKINNFNMALNQDLLMKNLSGFKINLKPDSQESVGKLINELINGYNKYSNNNLDKLGSSLNAYFTSDEFKQVFSKEVGSLLTYEDINQVLNNQLLKDVFKELPNYLDQEGIVINNANIVNSIEKYLNSNKGKEALNQVGVKLSALLTKNLNQSKMQSVITNILKSYQVYLKNNNQVDINQIINDFNKYLDSKSSKDIMSLYLPKIIDFNSQNTNDIFKQVQKSLGSSFNLNNLFKFDPNVFKSAFKVNMDANQIQNMFKTMMTTSSDSLKNNLRTLGYGNLAEPESISIYPNDFEAKNKIVEIINEYNQKMKDTNKEDKVISYTDFVAAMMSSVTDIINAISYVLIAFVAISLIVSSIMIGVITYISVLERRKEIGILRAIGASKKNISQVFNAETFITGLLAGIIGIGITLLLTIPINAIIYQLTNQAGIKASLPLGSGFILIGLSVILTLIAGIIPARKAAKSDPVTSLRSE